MKEIIQLNMREREYFGQKEAEDGHYNFVLQGQNAEEDHNFHDRCKEKAKGGPLYVVRMKSHAMR